MGNYRLNEVVGQRLMAQGHDVWVLEQLNGRKPDERYEQQLRELKPDVVYFEMLDQETFNLVKKVFKDSLKILVFASGGILDKPKDIIKHKGKWYDKVMTNSREMFDLFTKNKVRVEYFPYYLSVIEGEPKFNDKYNHDSVFLGMGFNRLIDPQYERERTVFFKPGHSFDMGLYGNGWSGFANHRGLLPPNDIGSLYHSSITATAIIAKGQRELGMINNRYTEIAVSGCPIITMNYPTIDWHGLDKWISFVDSRHGFESTVKRIKDIYLANRHMYDALVNEQKEFMLQFDVEYFQKLNKLIA